MQVQLCINLARDSAEMLCPFLPLFVQDVQNEPAQHTDPLQTSSFIQSAPFPLDQFVQLITPLRWYNTREERAGLTFVVNMLNLI